MAFVQFTQFGRRDSGFISITNSNSFGFGGDFLKKHHLEKKEFIELFYDENEKKIGFRFVDSDTGHVFKLMSSKVSDSKSVVARSFFTTYLKDIDMKNYDNRYEPEVINDSQFGELFMVQLKSKNK